MKLLIDHVPSPIGTLQIVSDGETLCALEYEGYDERLMRPLRSHFGDDIAFAETDDPQGFSTNIRAYLDGDLDVVDEVPVATGGTAFQQRVWAALRQIPTGTTATYGELAAKLGNTAASRAVGLANSLNPIAIVVPCHRVIGANGKLTGYAGGLDRKRWLLSHEGVLPGEPADKQIALTFA